MGLLQGRRRTRITGASQIEGVAHDCFDDAVMRRESTAVFTAHKVATDPYTAWLEQRKAEREPEEQAPVRWVVGYRGEAGSGRSAAATTARDEAAAHRADPRSKEPIYG